MPTPAGVRYPWACRIAESAIGRPRDGSTQAAKGRQQMRHRSRGQRGAGGAAEDDAPRERVQRGAAEELADARDLDDRGQHGRGPPRGREDERVAPADEQGLAQFGTDEGGQPDGAGGCEYSYLGVAITVTFSQVRCAIPGTSSFLFQITKFIYIRNFFDRGSMPMLSSTPRPSSTAQVCRTAASRSRDGSMPIRSRSAS